MDKFRSETPCLDNFNDVWVSLEAPNFMDIAADNLLVPIGEHAVANIMLSLYNDRNSDIYGIEIYHNTVDLIPESWFYKEWLFFITKLEEKGYSVIDCNRDSFLKSKRLYIGKLRSKVHCSGFRMTIWKKF